MAVLTHANSDFQLTHFAGTSSCGNAGLGVRDPFAEKYKMAIGMGEGQERYFTVYQNISMGTFFFVLNTKRRTLPCVDSPCASHFLSINISDVPP